ncbi:Gfo/Idh/MocA family oxidoreductase [Micromonospora sp. R77]|uniref:Gfo/Idh/MocA family protein n=1 Tax=Micromonospora sp. R77 TaxID=2925836 RepID=UPI001F6242A3|nr:Gfo/Idh/MocA family oxidoreductase [Micromonospora sp. R77]MCI4066806.1 Gfo/Idh/MocA family oxidoreductase [Micromonospora sp. R77]
MTDRAVVLVGCGYAADFYVACLRRYPHLTVLGAYDVDPERAETFCRFHGVPRLSSLAEALDQDAIVVNLTSIESHYPVTREALRRGRHVFSEKPLGQTLAEALELQETARANGLLLSSAPSTALGPCHGAVRDALRDGVVGRPLVVYANLEDGPVHKMEYERWISPSGQPWPARDEFAAGPILEHAGYQLTWLISLFGGVTEMTGVTTTLTPPTPYPSSIGPRFGANLALWSLTHDSGVITRLNCGGLAPRDYALRIVGDGGVLDVADVMRVDSEITYRREEPLGDPGRIGYLGPAERLGYDFPPPPYDDTHYIDFAAGVAELAACLDDTAAPRLGTPLSVHVLELTLHLTTAGARTVTPATRYLPEGATR